MKKIFSNIVYLASSIAVIMYVLSKLGIGTEQLKWLLNDFWEFIK